MPTPEEKILNQLQGAPQINPASARLFTDWTLEPGDVVTVRSTEGDSVRNYQLPIYSMDFNWNGSPMMEISSSGNPEREPLPELVRKEYAEATSSRGMGRRIADVEEEVQQQYQTWQTKTNKLIGDYAKITGVKLDSEGNIVYEDEEQTIPVFDPTSPYSLYAKHEVTAQNIVDYVGLTGIKFGPDGKPIYKQAKDAQGNPIWETDEQGNYVLDDEGNRIPVPATDSQGNPIPDLEADGHSMYSQISQSLDEINIKVQGKASSAEVRTLANKVGMFITANGDIDAAAIFIALNGDGSTNAYIKADKIQLDGTAVISAIEGAKASDGQTRLKISADSLDFGGFAVYRTQIASDEYAYNLLAHNITTTGEIWAKKLTFETLFDGDNESPIVSTKLRTGYDSSSTMTEKGTLRLYICGSVNASGQISEPSNVDLYATDFPHYHTVTFDNATGQITIGGITATAPAPFDLTRTTWYQNQISAERAAGRGEVFLSNAVYGEVTEQNGQYYLPFTYKLVYSNPTEQEPNATTIVQSDLTAYPTGFNAIRNAIYNSVTMSGSWNTVQALGAGRTWTVSSSNSAEDIVKNLTLSMGSWLSSGTRPVSLMDGGSAVALVNVSAPSLSGSWPDDSTGANAGATNTYHVSQKDGSTTVGAGHSLALEITQASATDFTFDAANQRYTFTTTATVSDGNTVVLKGSYGTSQNPLTHSATKAVNYGRSLVTIDQDTSWSNGSLTVKTAGRTNASGTAEQSNRTISLSQGTESLSNAVYTVPVLDGNNTPTGFSVVVDASDLVTPAQVINVNKGQWVYNAETQDSTQITFSPSSGSGSAQTLTLTMGERTASWSTTHKKRIDVFDGFTQTSATRTGVSFLVDASDQYYLGKSTVGLSDTGWTNGSRTIGTSGRTDASGTESNASRTIQISVPSSDFSITSSYDSQSEHVTITASAVAKDVANNGNITVATGTSTEVNKAISVSNITLGKSFSRSSAGGQALSHSGSVSISRSGGGVVSFGTINTVTAEVTSCSVPITLQTPSTSFNWDSTNHVYTYTTSASVAVDGTNDALTRSVAGTLTPTDAINHGRTLVSLNDMTWNPITGSSYPASQTISAKTSGRTNASGTAQEITKTLDVNPSLSFDGTNIYARLQVGSGSTTIAQVSGTISVTGASVTSSQVAYNKTNRTARGQVTGTISGTVNNTTFSKTFTLSDVNFDWAYQDGLNGNAYSERDYEFEDSSTGWSDEYPLNLREVYQKGVDDAEPVFEPVARYVWAESNNGAIKFYKNSTGSTRWGTLEYNTRVWLLDPDAVNDRYYVAYRDGYDNEWAGYIPTQYVHENRKDAYGGGGWVEEPAGSEKTMYIYAANGEPVSVYSSASTSSEIGKLYPNTEVTRVSTSGTWTQIRVTSGGRTVKGYLQNGSVSLRDTDNSPSHYSLTGWVSPPQTVTVTGILIQDVQHNSGIFSSPLNVKMADTRTTVMREFTSTATQSAAYEAITTSGDPSDYLELVNTTSGVKYYAWHNSSTNSGDVGHKVRLAVSYSNGNTETVWINIFSKASSTYQYIS